MPIGINGSGTITGLSAGGLPDGTITSDDLASNAVTTIKITDANVTPAKLSQKLTLATAQNTTSGTSIDFTSIPSWVKRVTVVLSSISTSGTSNVLCRIGTSGGVQATSYSSCIGVTSSAGTATVAVETSGFILSATTASSVITGVVTITNQTGNVWAVSGTVFRADGATYISNACAGITTLSGTLDRVRLTTVNGTDTFDSGVINIMYEG